MQRSEPQPEARATRRGNELGLWFFMVSLRIFGLRGAYGLLYIVCLYYVLFDAPLVRSALPYIRKRFPGCGPFRERLHVYRLVVSQGKHLIDRYAAVSGRDVFDIQIKGYEEFVSRIGDSREGAILLVSHAGNWQVAMTALKKMGKTVHLVMIPVENPALQNRLYPNQDEAKVRVISPQRYLGGVVEIMNALKKGHVVSVMGDRRYGAKALEVSFLGEKAWFPYSAFSIAASAECPVVVLEATKVSAYRYLVDMSNVLYPRYEGRRNKVGQLQPWVQKYAILMESFVKEHPYECFLFRDVWDEEADAVSA